VTTIDHIEALLTAALADETAVDALVLGAVAGTMSEDPEVRFAAAHALGQFADQRGAMALLPLVDDPDPEVRLRAVISLPIASDDPNLEHPAVARLIQCLDDPDPVVRDWATSGLGWLDVDSPAMREKFLCLLDDPEEDTAGEAAVALARRRDGRVLERLLYELADPDTGNLWVEAAAWLGDKRLVPRLLHLRDVGWAEDDPRPEWLPMALANCSREQEFRRLRMGVVEPGDVQAWPLSRVEFQALDPNGVIERIRDVLITVYADQGAALPDWLIAAFATPEEAAATDYAVWDFEGWSLFFDADDRERKWAWWDAGVSDPESGWLEFDGEHPTLSLYWLLRAAGARSAGPSEVEQAPPG
jgi:hypothetical protein